MTFQLTIIWMSTGQGYVRRISKIPNHSQVYNDPPNPPCSNYVAKAWSAVRIHWYFMMPAEFPVSSCLFLTLGNSGRTVGRARKMTSSVHAHVNNKHVHTPMIVEHLHKNFKRHLYILFTKLYRRLLSTCKGCKQMPGEEYANILNPKMCMISFWKIQIASKSMIQQKGI